MKNRIRPLLISAVIGLGFGILVGAGESVSLLLAGNRYGNSATFIFLAITIYASIWLLLGFILGVFLFLFSLLSKAKPSSLVLNLLAVSVFVALSLFVFAWGYINTRFMVTDFSLRSMLIDLVVFIFSVAIAFFVYRLLWRYRQAFSRSLLVSAISAGILLVVVSLSLSIAYKIDYQKPQRMPDQQAKLVGSDLPNILFLVIDALRVDHVSCYGYERNTTPTLDSLAHDGIVFENAIAPSSHTKSSTASYLTGLLPHHHKVWQIGQGLSPSLHLIPEVLRRRGYRTCIVSANQFVSPMFGFDQSVDFFYAPKGAIRQNILVGHIITFLSESGSPLRNKYLLSFPFKILYSLIKGIETSFYAHAGGQYGFSAEGLNKAVHSFLSEKDEQPFFVYAHYMEPHIPYYPPAEYATLFGPKRITGSLYRPPEEFRGKVLPFDTGRELTSDELYYLVSQYDGEIRYCDDQIGKLVKELQSMGRLKNTVIIITADHGEEFYDHRGWAHGHSVFQELIHVPLIVWWPNKIPGPIRVTEFVSLVDLAPTFYELASIIDPPPTDGRSLFKFSEKKGSFVYDASGGDTTLSEFDWGGRSSVSLIDGRYKYIKAQKGSKKKELLFDLSNDPGETVDLSALLPGVVEDLRDAVGKLQEISPGMPETDAVPVELDEVTRERLKALGYIE